MGVGSAIGAVPEKRARQAERSKTRKPLQLMKRKEHTLVYKAQANANTGF
jgi:hypothetical protein